MDGPCYNCGSTKDLEVHHVKKLSNSNKFSSPMKAIMSKLNRKQIVLCKKCHKDIHSGKYDGKSIKKYNNKNIYNKNGQKYSHKTNKKVLSCTKRQYMKKNYKSNVCQIKTKIFN